MKALLWFLGALFSLCAFGDLEVLGQLPDFKFPNSEGRTTALKDLAGKVWVADFIFTRCGGQCPILNGKMLEIRKAFEGEKDLKLVSFSVDPEHDTPKVLSEYAKQYHADPSSWFFLTGTKNKLDNYIRDAFHLAGGNGDKIAHSSRLVLVDKKGQIRGYYAATEPEKLQSLQADLKLLLKE